MVDRLTTEARSRNMSRIKSRDTVPELAVRKVLYDLGYRYRLHSKKISGKPDIVLAKYKSVIFVHGCFWHRHSGCKLAYIPKSREEFWKKKFDANVRRDEVVKRQLAESGWKQLTIWECETGNQEKIKNILREFLNGNG